MKPDNRRKSAMVAATRIQEFYQPTAKPVETAKVTKRKKPAQPRKKSASTAVVAAEEGVKKRGRPQKKAQGET
jgi:hypothetical protein